MRGIDIFEVIKDNIENVPAYNIYRNIWRRSGYKTKKKNIGKRKCSKKQNNSLR